MTHSTVAFITERELSEILQRGPDALRRDRAKGVGVPYVRVGGSIRYRLSDVESYIERNTVDTTGDAS